ncbi:MAG: tryptophan--tRNA ligase, partial [Planctomycetales bacterium]|nr:tryptophan--tRNA ligase [Planctomycetales bacterium]
DESYYFIANLHALTTVRDKELLMQYSMDAAIDLLALGLDPERAILFIQSDVPEVSELCWLLMTGTNMGLLERCHAYKDKKEKGLKADAGLFTYPVLMAADILAYDSDVVPVGEDQIQHIEVTRDLAGSFNHAFGETFVLPKPKVLEASAKVAGTDGQKMSKSYNNTIEIFGELKPQRKMIMRMPTDSRAMEDPKDPDTDHLYQLYSLFVDDQKREEMAAMYRRGGFGYGEVKKALADAAEAYFAEARERRAELAASPERVREVLNDGASRARKKAGEVLLRAQRACGLKA